MNKSSGQRSCNVPLRQITGAHFATISARAGANVVLRARGIERAIQPAEEIGLRAMPIGRDVSNERSVIKDLDAVHARISPEMLMPSF
jgi:NADP-dependent 3-hydroxy acid dehydrogenase YdfG